MFKKLGKKDPRTCTLACVKPEVLDGLSAVAPVIAVRGNVDREFDFLPKTELLSINNHLIYLLHDLNALDLNPVSNQIAIVVTGHSHQARIQNKEGVWYINPGSIGPRRFKLPIALVKLRCEAAAFVPELIELRN